MRLDPRAAAAGVRLVSREEIGSTNGEAMALARAGERGPLWITAARQTAGRGRRGEAWVSAPGNLFASLLLSDPAPAERRAQLSLVAALATHDALRAVAPPVAERLAIKWPNDVLLDGRKLAGILVEAETGEISAVVIGIGVNCANHPSEADRPATDLASAGAAVAPEALFAALSGTMLDRLSQWSRGDGFAGIRTDWLERAAFLGREIRVRFGKRDLTGRFDTIDGAGRLVLRMPDGRLETHAAGEVFGVEPVTSTPAATQAEKATP